MSDEKDRNATALELEHADTQATTTGGPVARPEGKVYLTASAAELSGIKFAKDGHTILVPQPSADPQDPLNWSFLKKHLFLGILSATAFIPEYTSAAGAPALFPQAT